MKKICLILFAIIIFVLPCVYAEGDVNIVLNGDKVFFSDTQPFIENDRTFVPIRAVSEILNYEVLWDEKSEKVTIKNNDKEMNLIIGNLSYNINDEEKQMDVAPFIKSDRTMVPLRFIAEGFGCTVGWDEESETVFILNYETEIPEYIMKAGVNALQRLREWAGDEEIFTAVQVTDVHKDFKQLSYFNALSSIINADLYIHNGDFDFSVTNNTIEDLDKLNEYLYETRSRVSSDLPILFTNGNHDSSIIKIDSILDKQKYVFDYLNKPTLKVMPKLVLSDDSSYGYVDFDEKKIRLVFVNTTNTKSSCGISTAQYDFIASALKSVPNGYNVVFTSHIPPNSNITNGNFPITGYTGDVSKWILNKYVYLLNDFNEKAKLEESLSGYDFSNVSENSRIVCSFHGHTHFNSYQKLKLNPDDIGVNYFCRQGFGGGYKTGDIELPSGIIATYDRFDHNRNCLFDIIAVKVNSNTAKVIRIGQGAGIRDFEFSW